MLRKLTFGIVVTAALAVGAGCSDDGGDGSPTGGGGAIKVGGAVYKGSVEGATVRIHGITAAGAVGAEIAGPFTTDANGNWSGEVPEGTSGYHLLTALGGTYTDEATGKTVTVGSQLQGLINVGGGNVGNVTPITHAIVSNAGLRFQLGATKKQAYDDAISDMTAALGFDPSSVAPGLTAVAPGLTTFAHAGSGTAAQIYAVLLAGISELIDGNILLSPTFDEADTWDLVAAVAVDLSDGALDGLDIFDTPILVDPDGNGPGTPIQIPPLDDDDIQNLVDAANQWAQANFPNVTVPDIDLSTFGNPTIGGGGGGDYMVSGSLTVSGSDAGMFGSPFTPDMVFVSGDELGMGFGFGTNNFERTLGVAIDTGLEQGITIVAAQVMDGYWSAEGFPVPNISVTSDALDSHFTIVFEGTELTVPLGTGTLIFNGTLKVDRQ